jgi:hypothetical protein
MVDVLQDLVVLVLVHLRALVHITKGVTHTPAAAAAACM